METAGRVAMVTGAARRVGRAIALDLARAGFGIAVHCHRSLDAAAQVVADIERLGRPSVIIQGDLADPTTPEKIVAQTIHALGRLDVLVNSASVFERTPIDQADAGVWERILRVNTIAPALLARAAAPIMRSQGAGRIVNLIDVLADRPIRHHGPYCASKAALACLTRSLAIELAPQITVNGISPGIAVFPDHFGQALRDRLVSQVPLHREGTPEEVAALVRFLVTQGDYITGQVIPIDGGWSIA